MKTVETGDYVKICYKGKRESDEVFAPSRDCKELEFQVGSGEVMRGLEEALVGMGLKEKKTFTLKPEEAFGLRDEHLKKTFLRSELPFDFQAHPGDIVALRTERGDEILATVEKADEKQVIIDMNHPLAGERVIFEVTVEEIFDESIPAS